MRCFGIHLIAISQKILNIFIIKLSLRFINLRLHSNPPGANELCGIGVSWKLVGIYFANTLEIQQFCTKPLKYWIEITIFISNKGPLLRNTLQCCSDCLIHGSIWSLWCPIPTDACHSGFIPDRHHLKYVIGILYYMDDAETGPKLHIKYRKITTLFYGFSTCKCRGLPL